MSGFFEEVKRRKVYRVAAAYIIAAGGIIQLASATFPAWELPDWALRLVIVLLLVGFPIALILAWAFDVTPQGIRATPSVAAPRTYRRRNVIMLVVTGVIVSAILEGSVRRAGNRVRVNVQLIDATTDKHIWANDYDRDLTDVFAIQTDLAHEIANALQAKLSDTEKARMERKPTENGEAYLAFVQAQNLGCAVEDFDKLKQSEQLYERAI